MVIASEPFASGDPLAACADGGPLAFLAAAGRPRTLAANDVLFREGQRTGGLYLVRAGTIALSLVASDGQEAILDLIGPGGCLGLVDVVDDRPSQVTASAIESAEVLFVPRDVFMLEVAAHSERLWAVTRVLAERLRRTRQGSADLVFLDARGRLAKRLLDLAASHGRPDSDGRTSIALRLAQRDLAALIGASRESLNKAVRDLRTAGAISVEAGRITLLDHDTLKVFAALDG